MTFAKNSRGDSPSEKIAAAAKVPAHASRSLHSPAPFPAPHKHTSVPRMLHTHERVLCVFRRREQKPVAGVRGLVDARRVVSSPTWSSWLRAPEVARGLRGRALSKNRENFSGACRRPFPTAAKFVHERGRSGRACECKCLCVWGRGRGCAGGFLKTVIFLPNPYPPS